MTMSDELHNKLAQIPPRLKAIRRDRWPRSIRRKCRNFKPGTTVSEVSLSTFEQTHGIELPPDYRAFLATIGSEAAGPYGTLLPLERWNDLVRDPDRCPATSYLAMPSFLVPDVEFGQEDGFDLCNQPEPYQGLLPIVDRHFNNPLMQTWPEARCALVITGTARGRVVYIGDDQRTPYVMPDASFLDWYMRWLDELQVGIYTLEFNHIPRDSEDKLVDAFYQSTAPLDRRSILYALVWQKSLTERSDEVLRAGVQDEDASVRAAAVYRLLLRGERSVPLIVECLKDEDSSVRGAVIETLCYGKHVMSYIPEITAALERETDAFVFAQITRVLKDVKSLRFASLAKQANNPTKGIRMYIAYLFSQTYSFDESEGMEQLLNDEDKVIRDFTKSAFYRRGLATSIEWVATRLAQTNDREERDRLAKALDTLQRLPPSPIWHTVLNRLQRLKFW